MTIETARLIIKEINKTLGGYKFILDPDSESEYWRFNCINKAGQSGQLYVKNDREKHYFYAKLVLDAEYGYLYSPRISAAYDLKMEYSDPKFFEEMIKQTQIFIKVHNPPVLANHYPNVYALTHLRPIGEWP